MRSATGETAGLPQALQQQLHRLNELAALAEELDPEAIEAIASTITKMVAKW